MYCPHCGAENPEHEKECQVCGMTLPALKKHRLKKPSEQSVSLPVNTKGSWTGWARFMTACGFYLTAAVFVFLGISIMSGWLLGMTNSDLSYLWGGLTRYFPVLSVLSYLFGALFILSGIAAVLIGRKICSGSRHAVKGSVWLYGVFVGLFLVYYCIMMLRLGDYYGFHAFIALFPPAVPITVTLVFGAAAVCNYFAFVRVAEHPDRAETLKESDAAVTVGELSGSWPRFMCRFGYYMTAVIFLLVGVWYLSGWQYGIAFDGGVNLRDCFTITEYEALFRAIDALFGLYFISWAVCAIRLRRMLMERKLRAAKLTKRLYLLTLLLFLAYQLMILIVLLPYGMDGIEDLSQLDEYPYQFLLSFAFVIILFCAVMYIKNRRFFKSESSFTK